MPVKKPCEGGLPAFARPAAKCHRSLMDPLHSPLKAALWMGASIACFIVMSVAGRVATAELDVFQVMLIRSVIGFLMLLPLVLSVGGPFSRAMRTARPLQHVGRNLAHFAGQYAWLVALAMIPLAQLVAIEFTQPFWTALLAMLVLGERMTWRQGLRAGLRHSGRTRHRATGIRPDRSRPSWSCWRGPCSSAYRWSW